MKLLLHVLSLALWLFAAFASQAHEITFSRIDLKMNEAGTDVVISLPVLALLVEEPTPLPAGTDEAGFKAEALSPDLLLAIRQLVASRLLVSAGGEPVALDVGPIESTGTDVKMTAKAPAVHGTVEVDANLFPADTLHKAFVTVYQNDELLGQYALDRTNHTFTFEGQPRPLLDVIWTFIVEGIHHIFIGPDHILFILALILLGGSLWSQVKIATSFTVAHSITLTLATLDIVQLNSQFVESVIALSIVIVALHDLWQLQWGHGEARVGWRSMFAFGFGLIHGFGFASVLAELELPREALAWSLASFNIGVEIGQIMIIAVTAPILYALRRFAPAEVARWSLSGVTLVICAIGGLWFVERVVG